MLFCFSALRRHCRIDFWMNLQVVSVTSWESHQQKRTCYWILHVEDEEILPWVRLVTHSKSQKVYREYSELATQVCDVLSPMITSFDSQKKTELIFKASPGQLFYVHRCRLQRGASMLTALLRKVIHSKLLESFKGYGDHSLASISCIRGFLEYTLRTFVRTSFHQTHVQEQHRVLSLHISGSVFDSPSKSRNCTYIRFSAFLHSWYSTASEHK